MVQKRTAGTGEYRWDPLGSGGHWTGIDGSGHQSRPVENIHTRACIGACGLCAGYRLGRSGLSVVPTLLARHAKRYSRRSVTAGLAYSVARLTDLSIDDLLAGALLSPRTCPHRGQSAT